jgi:hypothetical protein
MPVLVTTAPALAAGLVACAACQKGLSLVLNRTATEGA